MILLLMYYSVVVFGFFPLLQQHLIHHFNFMMFCLILGLLKQLLVVYFYLE